MYRIILRVAERKVWSCCFLEIGVLQLAQSVGDVEIFVRVLKNDSCRPQHQIS